MALVFTLLGNGLGLSTKMVPKEASGQYRYVGTQKFQVPKADSLLVSEDEIGRRPPTEAEIQLIMKCAPLWQRGTSQKSNNEYSPLRLTVTGGATLPSGACAKTDFTTPAAFKNFYVGGSRYRLFNRDTGEVLVVENKPSFIQKGFDFVADNMCWLAAGTLVATGGGATMALTAKTSCDGVKAALQSQSSSSSQSASSGSPDGNPLLQKKSWVAEHPVATGAIAVGGVGVIGAVLFAILRR